MTDPTAILLLLGTRVSQVDPSAGCSWRVEQTRSLDQCLRRIDEHDEAHVLLSPATASELGSTVLRRLEYLTPGSVLTMLGSADTTDERGFTQHQEDFVVDALQEFRTPVTVVTEFANMLSDTSWVGSLNERQEDYVGRIRSAASELAQRIEDFRSSLSMPRGPAPSMGERPGLAEVLDRLEGTLAQRCQQFQIDDASRTACQGVTVRASGVLFERALQALCEWAVARTASGGEVCLRATCDLEEEARLELQLLYSDPTPTHEDIRVLVEGTVLDGVQRKSVTKLFGVGVELARSTALALGGCLQLEALPGGGGMFRMRLPVVGVPDLRNVA